MFFFIGVYVMLYWIITGKEKLSEDDNDIEADGDFYY